jgi:hypothetical protein
MDVASMLRIGGSGLTQSARALHSESSTGLAFAGGWSQLAKAFGVNRPYQAQIARVDNSFDQPLKSSKLAALSAGIIRFRTRANYS